MLGWCSESSSRPRRGDVGRFQWRLLETSVGPVITGKWGGLRGPLEPGWDLEEIAGAAPPDLVKRFAQLSTFPDDPRSRSP
ncbi:MAG: hypothetical protein KY463_14100 [Actinobacteria bacterium]|nr:hypothetical protein [Actinomycetota bacterium]